MFFLPGRFLQRQWLNIIIIKTFNHYFKCFFTVMFFYCECFFIVNISLLLIFLCCELFYILFFRSLVEWWNQRLQNGVSPLSTRRTHVRQFYCLLCRLPLLHLSRPGHLREAHRGGAPREREADLAVCNIVGNCGKWSRHCCFWLKDLPLRRTRRKKLHSNSSSWCSILFILESFFTICNL